MRTKLFLSYSHDDESWRDRFVRHLRDLLVVGKDLWLDSASIKSGDDWEKEISDGLAESRCALVLLSTSYLARGKYAREELEMIVEEQSDGLIMLPVLLEPCLWRAFPSLNRTQFVSWRDRTIDDRDAATDHEPRA